MENIEIYDINPIGIMIESVQTDVYSGILLAQETFELESCIGAARVITENADASVLLEGAITNFFSMLVQKLKQFWEWIKDIFGRIFKRGNDIKEAAEVKQCEKVLSGEKKSSDGKTLDQKVNQLEQDLKSSNPATRKRAEDFIENTGKGNSSSNSNNKSSSSSGSSSNSNSKKLDDHLSTLSVFADVDNGSLIVIDVAKGNATLNKILKMLRDKLEFIEHDTGTEVNRVKILSRNELDYAEKKLKRGDVDDKRYEDIRNKGYEDETKKYVERFYADINKSIGGNIKGRNDVIAELNNQYGCGKSAKSRKYMDISSNDLVPVYQEIEKGQTLKDAQAVLDEIKNTVNSSIKTLDDIAKEMSRYTEKDGKQTYAFEATRQDLATAIKNLNFLSSESAFIINHAQNIIHKAHKEYKHYMDVMMRYDSEIQKTKDIIDSDKPDVL